VVAAEDVSVAIAPGSFFTLLGPSGSGKTTTLMMVAGFVTPTRGDILVDGVSVARLPPQKRDLGMVFQSYAVFPHLTVFENVAFPLQVRGVARAEVRRQVAEALALVRLEGYERRLPRQLSGGEQQRVALARALVFRPRVLLMDEPLGALDKNLRSHMQIELKRIQRHLHVTVVYVTHDQEEALTMSDRVAVMRAGRIEQVGTAAELYESPVNPFVADFLGESNFLDGVVVAELQGEPQRGPGLGSPAREASNSIAEPQRGPGLGSPAREASNSIAEPQRGGVLGVEASNMTGPHHYLVRGAGGLEFRGVGPERLRPGQPVTAAVRPEKLTPAEVAAPGASNTGKGAVVEIVYAGDATRYRVALGAAGAVTVKVQNRLGSPAYATGEAITLSWAPAETRLFPRSVAVRGEPEPSRAR
jgi:ABC-type Fe3+/spermidine/putrescine transport system ATPase subunit